MVIKVVVWSKFIDTRDSNFVFYAQSTITVILLFIRVNTGEKEREIS